MKNMKAIKLTILFLAFSNLLNAQFTVWINDKTIQPNQEIKASDFKAMKISFANAKKIPEYTTGKGAVYVNINNSKDEMINQWAITADGYTAVADLLYPKTAKTYTVLNSEGTKTDFTPFRESKTYTKILEDAKSDINLRKLTVTVNISFEEKTGYNSYGTQVFLLDKFSFYIDVANSSSELEIVGLNGYFDFNKNPTYKSQYVLKDITTYSSFNINTMYTIKFNEYNVNIMPININADQQTELDNLKNSFENYMKRFSNQCNGDKLLKTMPVSDKPWDAITIFKTKTGYGNTPTLHTIFLPLDQKMNKDTYQNVKILEPVTLGSLSGYRFYGLGHSVKCIDGALFNGFNPKTNPEGMETSANYVAYLLKHPTNPQQLLYIYSAKANNDNQLEEDGVVITEEGLKTKLNFINQFVSSLTFK